MKKFLKTKEGLLSALIVTLLSWKQFALMFWWQDRPSVNPYLEAMTFLGGRQFVKSGYAATFGLPIFSAHVTPVEVLKETGVYTHYLSGDTLIAGVLFRIFGDPAGQAMVWARLVPYFLGLFAWIYLAVTLARYCMPKWRWSIPCLLAGIAVAPGFYYWGVTLLPASYLHVCMMLAFAFGIQLSVKKWSICRRVVSALLLGFVSLYLEIAGAFVLCALPLLGPFITLKKHAHAGKWSQAIGFSFFVGVGMILAFTTHFIQVAAYLDSWQLAYQDQIAAFFDRGPGGHDWSYRLLLASEYSDHVRAFFRLNAFHQLAIGMGLIFALPQLPPKQKWALAAANLGVCLSAYVWIFLMSTSSAIHTFYNPHLFMGQYLFFVFLWVRLFASNQHNASHGRS